MTTRRLHNAVWLFGLFVLALLPRLYSAQQLGWDWDYPGSFTLVNFDEGGSCRAALKGFDYSPLVGRQTIALASLLGHDVPEGTVGDPRRVKAYCHSPEHLLVARSYSAVTGAATVVVLAIIGLLLLPGQPRIAWTAAALLALSGFHISESHSGTVDAPSIFYIYTFFALLIYAVISGRRHILLVSLLLLVPAVWAKYWVFAIFSLLALLPRRVWEVVGEGLTSTRIVVLVVAAAILCGAASNSAFQTVGLYPLLALYYVLVPWRKLHKLSIPLWLAVPPAALLLPQIDLFATYSTGGMQGAFGTGYAAIGWNKWLRNLLNVPVLLIVALGLPACLFIPAGIKAVVASAHHQARAWLCLMPIVVFTLFMLFLAPVTYYRHYLALVPAGALLAAYGLWSSSWGGRRWFLPLFFIWSTLLAIDIELDYHRDPRIALRSWYQEQRPARVFFTYYVNPPVTAGNRGYLFRPEYGLGDAATLRQADYLILSENWYDTSFANELNGPLVSRPDRMIKTRPAYIMFYRDALAGRHPYLVLERALNVNNFMPELVFHRYFYGTFQLFVGDIRILKVLNSA